MLKFLKEFVSSRTESVFIAYRLLDGSVQVRRKKHRSLKQNPRDHVD
jgi:hypothetical protein